MSINEKGFGQAMTAALDGPERVGIKFRNHEFHIRPIAKTTGGNRVHVEGHMFHQLALRPDDKIIYSFDVVGGRPENLDIRFESGLDKLAKGVVTAVGVALKLLEQIGSGGNDKADGTTGGLPRTKPAPDTMKLLVNDGWKAESRFLIANIAVRLA
jgi:hypothetical protein